MSHRARRSLLPGLVLAFAVAVPRQARAEATADQRAAAQALFDEARRLVADRRYAEACPKLEESQRIDPGLGTLLNLADCQEQIGKTATAWTSFLEAAFQAKREGQSSREKTARSRATALEPRLSRLTILAGAGALAVEIKRDGVVVAASLVGTAVPVDPGEHTLTASAPGKKTWEGKVDVPPDGRRATVSVPALEDAGPDGSALRGPRTAGIVLTILGAGGLVAGAVLAVRAKQGYDDSLAHGCAGNRCTVGGAQIRNDARTYGDGATAAVVGGAVVAAGGAGLWIAGAVLGRRSGAPAAAVTAGIDPRGGAQLVARGTF